MTHGIRTVIGMCALAAGCAASSTTSPRVPPTDHDLQGSWGQPFMLAGNSFLMSLTESSGVVTGTGSFAGEAGPYGGLVVSGTIAAEAVRLQIIYNFEPHLFPTLGPDTAQFIGTLVTKDSVAGQLTHRGQTGALQLVRLRLGDPP